MNGLLIKDYYLLKKNAKVLLSIILFYSVISFFSENSFPFFCGMIILLMVNMVSTTFSYDEYNKWDKYVMSLPLSRERVVRSKYLLTVFLLLIACAIVLLFSFVSIARNQNSLKEIFMIISLCSVFGVVMIGTYIPFIYLFGVEKSRFILILIMMIPFLLVFLAKQLNFTMVSEAFLLKQIPILFLFSCLYFYGSYLVSCKIFKEKDL